MQGSRPARIGEEIRQELADLLAREVHDPGIGFVTVTHVKVSADLQVARAYYTTLGDETARKNTAKALERGEIDRAALRRVTGEVRRNLKQFERQLAKDLQAARRVGRDAAAQSLSATLASSAMAARAAAGMFAGIADALASRKPPRRR